MKAKVMKCLVVGFSLALVASGCGNVSRELRPAASALIDFEEYQVSDSDEHGQVMTVRNVSIKVLHERLGDFGAKMVAEEDSHSIWRIETVVYQLIQDGKDVMVIVLDNPQLFDDD